MAEVTKDDGGNTTVAFVGAPASASQIALRQLLKDDISFEVVKVTEEGEFYSYSHPSAADPNLLEERVIRPAVGKVVIVYTVDGVQQCLSKIWGSKEAAERFVTRVKRRLQ